VHYPGGHAEGSADSLKNMMNHFYDAVLNQTELSDSVATFKEGYQIMLINDAIVRSVKTGSWEQVSQV
jgi:predicted dehydrogenase